MSTKSDSRSSSSQSTTSEDNRIANDSGIVVASGGTYTNNLPAGAVDIFKQVLDFSGGILTKSASIVDNAVLGQQQLASKTIDTQNAVAQNAQLGNASFFTTNAPFIIAAVVAIAFIWRKK